MGGFLFGVTARVSRLQSAATGCKALKLTFSEVAAASAFPSVAREGGCASPWTLTPGSKSTGNHDEHASLRHGNAGCGSSPWPEAAPFNIFLRWRAAR